MSDIRAKSALVGADTDSLEKKANSKPWYEVITQQIAYLMSAVANQTNPNLTKTGGCTEFKPNGNGKYPSNTFHRPKCVRKKMTCGGVGEQDIVGENAPLPYKRIISLLDPTLQIRIQEIDQI